VNKEIGFIGKALRGLGGLGGATLGSMLGQAQAGSTLGTSLGASISKWLGAGDYTLSSNSIVSRSLKSTDGIPAMHSSNQSVVIRHKEYLGEIRGSTTFAVQHAYSLNPGVKYTFPWLAAIAEQFAEYKFKGVVFHYVPTSGSTSGTTNPAIGSVMMQTSYRATDSAPSSKVEMLNEYWATESAPSEAFCHPIECDPKENPFSVQYVRSAALPSNESALLYDLGTTYIAVSGQPASGNVVGDLWVTYEVELRKPLISSSVAGAPSACYLYNPTSPTTTDFFGPAATQALAGNLPCTFTARTISFPKSSVGVWSITVRLVGSFTEANPVGAGLTYTNCAAYVVNPVTASLQTVNRTVLTSGAGVLNMVVLTYNVIIVDPQLIATVQHNALTTLIGTATYCDASVFQIG
jgi:hypothetical protein